MGTLLVPTTYSYKKHDRRIEHRNRQNIGNYGKRKITRPVFEYFIYFRGIRVRPTLYSYYTQLLSTRANNFQYFFFILLFYELCICVLRQQDGLRRRMDKIRSSIEEANQAVDKEREKNVSLLHMIFPPDIAKRLWLGK